MSGVADLPTSVEEYRSLLGDIINALAENGEAEDLRAGDFSVTQGGPELVAIIAALCEREKL